MIETPDLTKERIEKYLSQEKRFDGRKPDEFRELTIETGISKNAEGSAKVKLGNTEVYVGVKLGLGEPYPDSPDKGNMMVTAELLPLSSSRYESGPPRFPAIELGRLVDRGIRESKFIDFEKLCIKEGEKVWTVFIDVYSINDDGNVLDAAYIGALAALKVAKMPFYDEKEEKIDYEKESEENIPLKKEVPLTITIHKIGEGLIVDPTVEEEDSSDARLTIGINKDIVSSIQKGEEKEFEIEEFEKILDMAEKVYKNLSTKIDKAVK